MAKKIYLTRHGQTDFNKKGIVQGSGIDSDLNDTGRAQAEAFFRVYQKVPFDKLYVSALKRTHQSMRGFLEKPVPVTILPELNEISWGKQEGIMVNEERNVYYQQMIHCWQAGDTGMAIEGGESPEQVAIRMKRALQHILSNTSEKNVLICMHGRAMRIMLTVMLNYPLRCMDMFKHSNLCLYVLTYTGSMFVVDRYNDTSHLPASQG